MFRAIVQENKDPLQQRRIMVSIPQTTGVEITDWVWPVEPHGVYTAVPTVGQGVWVSYLNGDPEFPIWHGSFGKHQAKSKPIYIKPLLDTTSLTGLTPYLKLKTGIDGTVTVDLTATLVAVSTALADHETRIASLESNINSLHATLATRTASGHTHTTAG
jgi:uncharacterized protein involved in type VI secretion and phage assembly